MAFLSHSSISRNSLLYSAGIILIVGLGVVYAQTGTGDVAGTCVTSGTCTPGVLGFHENGAWTNGCSDFGIFGCWGTCSFCGGGSTGGTNWCNTALPGTCIYKWPGQPSTCGAQSNFICARTPAGGCCPAGPLGGIGAGTCGFNDCSG